MVEQREMENNIVQVSNLSTRKVQCIGPHFLKYYKRLQGHSEFDDTNEEINEDIENTEHVVFDDDVSFLRSLDPKDWKNQDHYAVLGMKWLRFKATDDDIKRAYHAKVLKHHPDKRKAAGEEVKPSDDYFTCISKAWEILGNKDKRRSYDSVDPLFDNSIPSNNEHSRNNFFEVFTPVFERNARWSEKTPVPKLGGMNLPREQVEKFYSFWYNFESWREYSYLDEDEKEKGQDRLERRYIDKQNKAARAKLKKEEMSRIRSLVDTAYELDPRIMKFKQEEKEKKLASKRAKQEALKAKQEEEERIQREAAEKSRREKEEAEAEKKAKEEALKQEREALKRQMKQKRKTLRDMCKTNNYYINDNSELVAHMTGVEKICETFQLSELTAVISEIQEKGRDALVQSIKEIEKKLEEERSAHIKAYSGSDKNDSSNSSKKEWSIESLQLLIKAVNLFPAGTNQRWEVVAKFINQHCSNNVEFTAKEVLAKAKDLQNNDFTKNVLKETANKKAFDNFEKGKKVAKSLEAVGDVSKTTERFDTPAELQGLTPWTANEQTLLEQALRTYGPTTPDRWDEIAKCIPGRSKKDCMRRYKELAEMVKAKKAAQAAAAAKASSSSSSSSTGK
ncbi:conserved hypothetical protein [Pediculus humanus corporis]|uniref:DnaJ homolog subfamily C member 2 n=1 Tax=Pediculus humanus subsp. corporis TaxID=121224 RepID=E0VGD2_PEDHC|nr:uncharacterized protein Phum_PHUM178600 [Pediculus humanus corporis]EEB12438.1 conserved hypothetical protein [Pediculus humanus corporis]